jgi:hypothetical protein
MFGQLHDLSPHKVTTRRIADTDRLECACRRDSTERDQVRRFHFRTQVEARSGFLRALVHKCRASIIGGIRSQCERT